MNTLNTAIAAVGVIVAFVLFLGSVVVFLRGSRDKGTIEALTLNNAALDARVVILEKDLGTASARIDSLERENTALLAQRPSADAIAAIETNLATHDSETRKLLRAIVANVQRETGRD